MDCLILLLLLSCCGGFGRGNNGTCSADGRCGSGASSSLGGGNDIRQGSYRSDDGCGCSDNGAPASNDGCGCDGDQGINTVSGGPSHWQDFPEISRRDNDCGCEN